ncbi:MAG: MFS transporter [Nannocystaceae bacterium]
MAAAPTRRRSGRAAEMIALIVAGEAIFALPFHVARFFRPTLLEVYGLSPGELGALQGIYGVTALLAYFPSGLLADRWPARALVCAGLGSTALGGLVLLGRPGFVGLALLFGAWGITTVLPLWGALIRTTRRWGGPRSQGRAYGLLEGGRGLFAAAFASLGAGLLAALFPDDPRAVSATERALALREVITVYIAVTAGAAALAWALLRGDPPAASSGAPPSIAAPLRLPALWIQALIILAAYVGYKGFDDVALFAVDAWGYDEVEAAALASRAAWLRPIVCVAAGLLGDRVRPIAVLPWAFGLVAAGELALWAAPAGPGLALFFAVDVLAITAAIFALRALYFALFADAGVPMRSTGAAIGAVSVIGYLPDVFVNPLAGALVDAAPGAAGHQRFAAFLAASALVGAAASALFRRMADRRADSRPVEEASDEP